MTNCHVISLASATERRAFITEQFDKARVGFEFFDAVDAETLDLETAGYAANSGPILIKQRSELDPSEVACFESHRRLWEHCVQLDLDHIAIFEDDVLLTADFQDVLWNIGRYASDYDVIKLDWVPNKLMLYEVRNLYKGRKAGRISSWLPSAAAYIVSNIGARKLLHDSEQYFDTLDDFVFSPTRNWTVVQLLKPIATQVMWLPDELRSEYLQEVASGQRESWFGNSGDGNSSRRKRRKSLTYRINHECGKALLKCNRAWQGLIGGKRRFQGQLPFDFAGLS